MKILVFVFLSLFSVQLLAQEEAPKVSAQTKEQAKKFEENQNALNSYETEVKNLKSQLNELIQAKKSGKLYLTKGKDEKVDVLEAIVEKHRALSKAHSNYEKQRKYLKYRFPAKGDLIERRYMPLRPPSLQQVEREVGLNGRLSELKDKTDKKYAQFRRDAEDELEKVTTKKTYKKKTEDVAPKKRLKLSQ